MAYNAINPDIRCDKEKPENLVGEGEKGDRTFNQSAGRGRPTKLRKRLTESASQAPCSDRPGTSVFHIFAIGIFISRSLGMDQRSTIHRGAV